MKNMKILSFGEVLWDVYPDKEFIGGAPLNFAAHLAKHGEKVWMLTAVGSDNLGNKAVEIIENFNVNTNLISENSTKETGKCLVTLDKNSIPEYNLLQDVAYDYINCENIENSYDILYFGTLALRGKRNQENLNLLLKRNNFKEVFVDVNIRAPFYSNDTILFALKNATILKISDEELPVILKTLVLNADETAENSAKEIARKFGNLKLIIVTKGSKGAICLDCKTGEIFTCKAGESKAVSTVGAGDSFSAAFLHKYINEFDIDTCLKYATKIADFVVSRYEAVPEYDFVKIG